MSASPVAVGIDIAVENQKAFRGYVLALWPLGRAVAVDAKTGGGDGDGDEDEDVVPHTKTHYHHVSVPLISRGAGVFSKGCGVMRGLAWPGERF